MPDKSRLSDDTLYNPYTEEIIPVSGDAFNSELVLMLGHS